MNFDVFVMEASQEPMEKKSPKEKEISEDGKTGVSSSSPCPPVVADLKQPGLVFVLFMLCVASLASFINFYLL